MKAALGLTLIVAGVYLLTASGHLDGQDQEYYYRMARAVAQEKSFAIQPLVFQDAELAGKRGRGGNFYAQYAPGLPVALAPLVAVADLFRKSAADFKANYHWLRDRENDVLERILVSYFDIGIIAATAGVLLLLVKRLGYSDRSATYVGAVFALSTFACGQARIVNPEPLQTLLLALAFLLLFDSTRKRALVGGCILGCAVLVKITSVLALPALLVLPNYGKAATWSKLRTAASILLPVVGALTIYSLYNYARFGDLLASGYIFSGRVAHLSGHGIENPLIGFYGLLFSPGRGLIWYAPPVLAGAAGFIAFFRQKRSMAVAIALLITSWIVLHSCYQGWDSGWGWGPRYLLPILPFILVPAAEVLQRRAARVICLVLGGVGFLIQIPGALVDFMASGRAGMKLFGETAQERTAAAFVNWRNFHIPGSEIVRHFALLKQGQVDLAWQTFGGTVLPKITFALVAMLIVTGTTLLVSTFYSVTNAKTSPAQPHDNVKPEPP